MITSFFVPPSLDKSAFVLRSLFIVVLLITYGLTVESRWHQFDVWRSTPERHFVDEIPLVSTADAPYYLRLAKEHSLGEYKAVDMKREFPAGRPNPKDVPLLAWLLSTIGEWSGQNFSQVGNWLLIWGAGLFIIPLSLYGWQVGYPIAGLLGGLVGNYTYKYYLRTSVGRIDTDFLNLCFPLFAAYFLLRTFQAKTEKIAWFWVSLAGVTLNLFSWWYSRPGFTLVYFLVLLIGLLCWRHSIRMILTSTLIFIVFSGPEYFLRSLESLTVVMGVYFNVSFIGEVQANAGPATFPHAYNWIIETVPLAWEESLEQLLGNWLISAGGLLLFLIFIIRYWRYFLPLLPLFGLGTIGLLGSQRFLLYLTPFIGFGFGMALNSLISFVWQYSKEKTGVSVNGATQDERAKYQLHFFLYLSLCGAWLLLLPISAKGYIPKPTFPPTYYRIFQEIGQKTPQAAVIYTWWDLGNLILEQTGRALFHDGGSQYRPKTYFIARSLVGQSQAELAKIMSFLGAEGDRGIQKYNSSEAKLMSEILNKDHFVKAPLYLLYTDNLIDVFPTLFSIGKWDLQTQQTRVGNFKKLNCSTINNEVMECENFSFDLNKGFVNQKIPIRRIVQSFQGNESFVKEYHPIGLTLQLMLTSPNEIGPVYLLTEEVFNSNLNQMFLLGNYDSDLFEEIYHQYPIARVFHLKKYSESN